MSTISFCANVDIQLINKVNLITFTSNGIFVPNASAVAFKVTAIGGGGAGGSTVDSSQAGGCVGGGGGAGGQSISWYAAAELSSNQAIVVGNGGAGATNSPGGNGESTTFGSLLVANGGFGGNNGILTNASQVISPGAGGNASGGMLNIPGMAGIIGYAGPTSNPRVSGAGAPGFEGQGAAPIVTSIITGGYPGVNATGYGAGGSGAACSPGWSNSVPGGYGSNGVVFIEEYLSV